MNPMESIDDAGWWIRMMLADGHGPLSFTLQPNGNIIGATEDGLLREFASTRHTAPDGLFARRPVGRVG